jgi:hypothetical protein
MRIVYSPPFDLHPTARAAVKQFRDAKPWRGTEAEKREKFETLHRGLCRAYDRETSLNREPGEGSSAASTFDPRTDRITLRGRLSVVTYLFLFGAAVGRDVESATQFARETFRHFFPRSFRGCRLECGLLVRA